VQELQIGGTGSIVIGRCTLAHADLERIFRGPAIAETGFGE
jgi:hypothetical protein